MEKRETETPFIDRCKWIYRSSEYYQRYGRRRPLAFLLDYQRYSWLIRESVHSGVVEVTLWRPVPPQLFGFPVYVGPWAPPNGVLFLPEPTIRSMVGLWGWRGV